MAVSIGTVIALIKALGGKPDAATIVQAVNDWLDDHPEATTTVEDGSITKAKLATALAALIDGKQDAPAAPGTAGQVFSLNSNLDPVWANPGGGGGGAVDDVQLFNGTSIVFGGVATIPQAGESAYGVVKKGDSLIVEETVTGATPSITGVANHRYICGEVETLTITAPASGIIDVVFESGSTPTVLTVDSGIKWANGFDPMNLDADTTYELNIMDGELGVAGSWT